jgi:hypothetical protein
MLCGANPHGGGPLLRTRLRLSAFGSNARVPESSRAEFRINVSSDETWINAAKSGLKSQTTAELVSPVVSQKAHDKNLEFLIAAPHDLPTNLDR